MSKDRTRAEQWDVGSESDDLRNALVVPLISQMIQSEQPNSILDIGAGTGHMCRRVDEALTFRAKWTLVDIDQARLDVARERKSPNTLLDIVVGNITDEHLRLGRFGVVLVSFTLLETGISNAIVDRIRDHCAPEALVIVVMPDVLQDVLVAEGQRPGTARAFLAGETKLQKIDKFTNEEYPFHAVRVESILKHFLANRFALEAFEQRQIDQRAVFVFSFRHRVADHEHARS